MIRIVSLLTLLWLPNIISLGQKSSLSNQDALPGINHHVIILIDRSGTMFSNNRRNNLFKLLNNLNEICFKEGYVFDDKPLLDAERGDLLSIAGFGGDEKKIGDFISLKANNNSFGRKCDNSFSSKFIQTLKNDIGNAYVTYPNSGESNFFNKRYTGISFVKEYALSVLKDETKKVTRTFIFTLSDEVPNATGGESEILNFADQYRWSNSKKKDMLNIYTHIRSKYLFDELSINKSKTIIGSYRDIVKLKLFEVISDQEELHLSNVM